MRAAHVKPRTHSLRRSLATPYVKRSTTRTPARSGGALPANHARMLPVTVTEVGQSEHRGRDSRRCVILISLLFVHIAMYLAANAPPYRGRATRQGP
jgi:hypothetical protein